MYTIILSCVPSPEPLLRLRRNQRRQNFAGCCWRRANGTAGRALLATRQAGAAEAAKPSTPACFIVTGKFHRLIWRSAAERGQASQADVMVYIFIYRPRRDCPWPSPSRRRAVAGPLPCRRSRTVLLAPPVPAVPARPCCRGARTDTSAASATGHATFPLSRVLRAQIAAGQPAERMPHSPRTRVFLTNFAFRPSCSNRFTRIISNFRQNETTPYLVERWGFSAIQNKRKTGSVYLKHGTHTFSYGYKISRNACEDGQVAGHSVE